MSKPTIEVKVITEEIYYDNETCKHQASPVTIVNIKSWQSAKAFNPDKLKQLPVKTLLDAVKKLF